MFVCKASQNYLFNSNKSWCMFIPLCQPYLDDGVNPIEHLLYVAVDAGTPLPGTADTPAHHPN